MNTLLLIVAIAWGLFLAVVDTLETWDDTGVIAMAIVVSCVTLGALSPQRPWLWALAVGIWLPLFNIAISRNAGALLALVVAFVAAYAGMAIRKPTAPA